MNKNVLFAILLVGTLSACKLSNQAPQPVDYTYYVNTFIGAADNGHTFPGACVPFGMIQASPSTGAVGWRYCSEYINGDSIIWGFTQTHLSGTGCMDLGDILVMPVTGSLHRNWDGYRSRFEKSTESASPGYYTVELSDPKVKAELTATVHASFQRYTFHSADSAAILIDLQHGPVWNEKQYHTQVLACETQWEDAETLVGHVRNQVWVDQDYFFVMKFSRPVTNHFVLPKNEGEMGERIIASFDMKPEEELLVKVALSTTGIDGARKNLLTEVPAWDFEGTKMAAHDTWNSYLSRIDVTGTDEEKTNYYTSLYHALIQPNEISDVDGAYRNSANEIVQAHGGKSYSTFSCWDTYRAAHPFYTIMVPERVDGFVNSLVEHGEVQGYIPIWELWGKDNHCMIANHGISIVAEAFAKGFKGFDAEKAFEVIKHGQTVSHPTTSDWETYMKYGYFPDVIVVDSLDLLNDSSGKIWDQKSLRHKRIAVAKDLKDIAADINAWVFATYQATIEDPEWVNNEKNVLNGYNLSEAKGLQRPCTHLISLNQSVREEKENTMRIYVAKSRFFPKGSPFRICTDYEHEVFYDRVRSMNLPKDN